MSKKIFAVFVLFFIALLLWGQGEKQNKKLDRLLYGGVKNFQKHKWPECFIQGRFETEKFCYYSKEVTFMGNPVKEVIITFDDFDEFKRADILLDYAGGDGYPFRIPDLQDRVSSFITRFTKKEPEYIRKNFIGNRKIIFECWEAWHCRIYLYYHWKNGKGRSNISFVALRIEPKKEPKRDPLEWYQPKGKKLNFTVNTPSKKILKAPMRRQLTELGACWFTTYTRIAKSYGSEIPSIVLAVVMGGTLGDRYYDAWKQLGMMRNEIKLNSHKNVAANAIRFMNDYNSTAKRMRKSPIPVKIKRNGKRDFDRLKGELDPNVIKRVNTRYFGEKYSQFRDIITSHIDQGIPVRWSADLEQEGGAHAMLIVGYDLQRDIIYYSNHWNEKKELEKATFPGAFVMTTDLQTLLTFEK